MMCMKIMKVWVVWGNRRELALAELLWSGWLARRERLRSHPLQSSPTLTVGAISA